MSTLAEWRAQRQTTLTLPSGLDATLRRITVEDVAARGSIPTPLYGQVSAIIDQQPGAVAPTLDLASLPQFAVLIDVVAAAALVSPAVAEVADETHITIDELPFADRLHIFTWAQGGAAALAPFPGAAAGAGAPAAPAGDDLQTPAQRAAASLVA
jgi:hypothetical protein